MTDKNELPDGTLSKSTVKRVEALTQQRGELPSAKTFASAVWRDWMTNEQADKLGAELHAWLGAHVATTPQPSADAVREIYDAAAKGFHTSETNGAERKYLHVIRFQSIEDLHGYEDAWTAAMVKARDSK